MHPTTIRLEPIVSFVTSRPTRLIRSVGFNGKKQAPYYLPPGVKPDTPMPPKLPPRLKRVVRSVGSGRLIRPSIEEIKHNLNLQSPDHLRPRIQPDALSSNSNMQEPPDHLTPGFQPDALSSNSNMQEPPDHLTPGNQPDALSAHGDMLEPSDYPALGLEPDWPTPPELPESSKQTKKRKRKESKRASQGDPLRPAGGERAE